MDSLKPQLPKINDEDRTARVDVLLEILAEKQIDRLEQEILKLKPWSSRPRELPPQALTEPYVRLSPHTALHVPCKLP
ncbi:MAG: hypothetical protein Q8S52_04165, partial [Methylobacter sp.]|nr:hypothetical protein [Methylobacter sp.]